VSDYHILAPRTSVPFSTSSDSAAMQSYIHAVWKQYALNAFTLTRLGQTFTGQVQSDGMLHFSFQGTAGYALAEPTAMDVWQCSGALASGSSIEEALGAEFCAAFNRGVAEDTTEWWNSSQYYLGSVRNEYAAYFHSVCLNARTYAFLMTISTTKVRSSSFPTPRRPPPLR
jgi:hypothetical protein